MKTPLKLFILCLLTLLLSVQGFAKKLSLKTLIKFQDMPQSEIHQKLSKKGWTNVSDAKQDSSILGKAVWAFKPSDENAEAWCILYYSDKSPNRILYNNADPKAFKRILKKLKARKMTILEEGNSLERADYVEHYTDYTDQRHVIRFYTYIQPNYKGVKIFNKADYEKAKANNRLQQ